MWYGPWSRISTDITYGLCTPWWWKHPDTSCTKYSLGHVLQHYQWCIYQITFIKLVLEVYISILHKCPKMSSPHHMQQNIAQFYFLLPFVCFRRYLYNSLCACLFLYVEYICNVGLYLILCISCLCILKARGTFWIKWSVHLKRPENYHLYVFACLYCLKWCMYQYITIVKCFDHNCNNTNMDIAIIFIFQNFDKKMVDLTFDGCEIFCGYR